MLFTYILYISLTLQADIKKKSSTWIILNLRYCNCSIIYLLNIQSALYSIPAYDWDNYNKNHYAIVG